MPRSVFDDRFEGRKISVYVGEDGNAHASC